MFVKDIYHTIVENIYKVLPFLLELKVSHLYLTYLYEILYHVHTHDLKV